MSNNNSPVLCQQKRAMRSFHDYDLPGRYFSGRHGVSSHITSIVPDIHRLAAGGIKRIPLFLENEAAVTLFRLLHTRLRLVVHSQRILLGGFVETFALVHYREHHSDVRLELLLALQRYSGVVESFESPFEGINRFVVSLQAQQASGPPLLELVCEILRITELRSLLDVLQRAVVTLQVV